MTFYSSVHSIYDYWIARDPALTPSLSFYLAEALTSPGAVLELGVGNGRIGVELARQGKRVIGVDTSYEMLQSCRLRAVQLGIPSERLMLVQSDALKLGVGCVANLVIMPLRTIGHFLTREDRLSLFEAVYEVLPLGGTFMFDHFIFDVVKAQCDAGKVLFLHSWQEKHGGTATLRHSHVCDHSSQTLNCTLMLETDSGSELVLQKFEYRLAWIEPEEIKDLSSLVGFRCRRTYGSFDRGPFLPTSREQVWLLDKE